MNDLGMTLIWSAGRVTVLTLLAAALYGLVFRRRPAARALVAALSLGLGVVVPSLAFCPLPGAWAWDEGTLPEAPAPVSAAAREDSQPAAAGAPRPAEGDGLVLPRAWLHAARERLAQAAPAPGEGAGWRWPAVAAVILLAGAGLGLLRLLVGLAGVHRYGRRSRPIDDPSLTGLAEQLRLDMGCAPVELREAPELAGPATVGWRRPLILLPADWRGWDEAERRAVLAHELAHVGRADYLTWLVARLSVALHFYHPLVHWLAGRLQLQQELAADALAARFAGGREAYLVALARMALQQDGPTPAWPARAFLSTPGTLLRRIQMLRARDGGNERPLPRGGRAAVVALLAAVAVGVSALRSPAQKAGGAKSEERPARPADTRPAPFELTYLDPESPGFVALHPAALFGRPEMKPAADEVDAAVGMLVQQWGLKEGLGVGVRDLEQLSASLFLVTNQPRDKGPETAVLARLITVRTVKDFDWKGQLRKLAGELAEVECAGKVYYKMPKGRFVIGGPNTCFLVPDARTVVLDDEPHLRDWLQKAGADRPRPAWLEDWKHVERGLVGVAFDARDQKWLTARKQPDASLHPALVTLLKNVTGVAAGFDYDGKFTAQAFVRCRDERGGEKAAAAAIELRDFAAEAVASEFWKDLLKHSQVTHHGNSVRWRLEAENSLQELVTALSPGKGKK